ncbi:hypothetical protein AAG570_004657 [Ranatra chinensis]|uniref:Glucose-methanol-choline oxidoreductase N-terminal domain-containing protein n=1 Tax=Ranatra chinensis TaxID=642074 RepID=A0ABD0Y1H7_9HEMI
MASKRRNMFQKNKTQETTENGRFHSRGGLLGVSTTDQPSPLSDAFLEAVREVGYPAPVDVNGENQNGFTRYQATTADGIRSSTAKAFLTPAKNRTNLHLALRSTVTRVVIDPATKKALGVEFTRDGQKVIIHFFYYLYVQMM